MNGVGHGGRRALRRSGIIAGAVALGLVLAGCSAEADDGGLSAEDRFAIQDLYYSYAFSMDDADPEAFGELFSEDATYDLSGTTLTGREEIASMADRAPNEGNVGFRHIVGGVVVEESDSGATGRAYVHVFQYNEDSMTLLTMGEYVDEFVEEDGRWYIQHRAFNPLHPEALGGLVLGEVAPAE